MSEISLICIDWNEINGFECSVLKVNWGMMAYSRALFGVYFGVDSYLYVDLFWRSFKLYEIF